MPFGLKNAPATFPRAIDDVLRDYIGKICYVCIDDVIDLEEHSKNLKVIYKALNEAGLKIQSDKSEFLHQELEFLGYILSSEGIKPNQKKFVAIILYPEPKNIKELQEFSGMMGYNRRFV